MFEQFELFQDFAVRNWSTYSDFVDYMHEYYNNEIVFQGENTLKKVNFNSETNEKFVDTLFLFKLNDGLFASIFKENRDKKGHFYFDGISQLSEAMLKSPEYLELIRKSSKNRFKDLGVSIPIDLKCYIYEDEQRIIMSQAGKVDMIYSQRMYLDENDNFLFKAETSVSLGKLVEWHKFNQKTMERLRRLEEEKNK